MSLIGFLFCMFENMFHWILVLIHDTLWLLFILVYFLIFTNIFLLYCIFFVCLKTNMFERMNLWKLELVFLVFLSVVNLLICSLLLYLYDCLHENMYVCKRVFTIIYYRVLGCFVLLFVMYFITWDSLFLSSFDFTYFVCMFGRLIVCVFGCLKTYRRIKCPLCLLDLFVNLHVWLHVSLFSITFLHSCFIC